MEAVLMTLDALAHAAGKRSAPRRRPDKASGAPPAAKGPPVTEIPRPCPPPRLRVRLPPADRLRQRFVSRVPALDTEAEMARLTPEQRDRVYNVATRRLAFQILYQLDAAAIKGDIAPVLRDELARVSELGPIAAEKCAALVTGAWANRSQSDADLPALKWPRPPPAWTVPSAPRPPRDQQGMPPHRHQRGC
jgi:hypothetical protein